jgi:hypothetical protein
MNEEAASWFISHLDDGDLKIGHAPEATKQWLKGLGLPLELYRFLMFSWPQTDCQIGPVNILCSKAISEQESLAVFLQHKLLPVGSGPNGDTFAIDYSTDSCPVGFVTHEEYFGEGDPREFFRTAARSIESFLYRISEGRYFPCDYYATGYFNEFLRAEASHEAFPPYSPRSAE